MMTDRSKPFMPTWHPEQEFGRRFRPEPSDASIRVEFFAPQTQIRTPPDMLLPIGYGPKTIVALDVDHSCHGQAMPCFECKAIRDRLNAVLITTDDVPGPLQASGTCPKCGCSYGECEC